MSPDEQKQVLGKRRGNTLSRRSILKSYHPTTKKQHNVMHIDGVSELRQAKGMPVFTMGSANLRGLRRYLSYSECTVTLSSHSTLEVYHHPQAVLTLRSLSLTAVFRALLPSGYPHL